MPQKTKRSPSKSQKSSKKPKGSLTAMIKAELAKPVIPGEVLTASGDSSGGIIAGSGGASSGL